MQCSRPQKTPWRQISRVHVFFANTGISALFFCLYAAVRRPRPLAADQRCSSSRAKMRFHTRSSVKSVAFSVNGVSVDAIAKRQFAPKYRAKPMSQTAGRGISQKRKQFYWVLRNKIPLLENSFFIVARGIYDAPWIITKHCFQLKLENAEGYLSSWNHL